MARNTFRLQVVQQLAQKDSDKAATRLGLLNAEVAKADQKLQMLIDYREEYRQRFRSTLNGDALSAGWKNFQQFLVKLEEAIEQQRAACDMARRAVLGGQREWQAKQIKVKAFDSLEQRHHMQLEARTKKLEQLASDEFAARAYHQKG
jgi:flagellar FliJ protein